MDAQAQNRDGSQEDAMAARKLATNAVAVSDTEGIDPRHQLGTIAMYTLPDEPRNGADALKAWTDNGLDPDEFPDARQPVHVFQSACASVNTRRGETRSGERVEIRADEVQNNGTCDYQITVKVWDVANRVIEHEKALRVSFDKRASRIAFDHLGYEDVQLKRLERAIGEHFRANAQTVPGQKIRNAIRNALRDHAAQNLRRKAGGVYFLPKRTPAGRETQPIIDGIGGFLTAMYGDDADFDTIPLVNDEGRRAMVRKHFTLNANAQLQELSQKAWQRVRQGKGTRNVRSDLIANLENERRTVVGALRQFEQLVQAEQTDVKEALDDLDAALDELDKLRNEE